MKNQIITNRQPSIVALAPLLDAAGNALVLQPKGKRGDEREITAETAEDEIVKRVVLAGWVRLSPVGTPQPAQQPQATAPKPAPPPPAPPKEPEPEPVPPPAPPKEPEPEPTPAPEEPKASEPAVADEPPPPPPPPSEPPPPKSRRQK